MYKKIPFLCVGFILTPCFFIFELSVVRPAVVEAYQMKPKIHAIHVLFSTFLFINVFGNMIMSALIDVAVGNLRGGRFCEDCNEQRPKNSWHCKACNICVLKRDHHCTFFSKCVGLNNQRYYILYLFHLTISMAYTTYYNFYFVLTKFESQELVLSVFRIMNPFLRLMIPEPMGSRDVFVLFLLMTTGLLVWSIGLLVFHLKNVVRGVTAREYKKKELYNCSKWKENLLNVFGEKWYLAAVWPFVDSALPVKEQ